LKLGNCNSKTPKQTSRGQQKWIILVNYIGHAWSYAFLSLISSNNI